MENKEFWVLFAVLILASFFRLWKLNEIPPGLYPDVALNGTEAFFSLKNKDFKVFYPENFGREGLMMWLIAISFSIFGVSLWALKFTAAFFGILTVLGVYLLVKELYQERIALFSSFFLAISFWHTNFSRIGFRVILFPFFLVFAFYFLFLSLKRKNVLYSLLAGIFFGLGFYTYTSFRMCVLILPFIFVPYFLLSKKEGWMKKFFLISFCFFLFCFLIALPLGIYFLKNPHSFLSRTEQVTIFGSENILKEFLKSFFLHLAMFNFYGDANWRHNFSTKPMLFWPIGILFLVGFLRTIFDSLKIRKHYYLGISSLFFLSWFFVVLFASSLTKEGVPHALRMLGIVPAVFFFVGIASNDIFEVLLQKIKSKRLVYSLVFTFLVVCTFFEFNKYFFQWGQNENVKEAFTQKYFDIGEFLNTLPEGWNKYVIVNEAGNPLYGISIPAQTPMFIEITKFGKTRATYLKYEELDKIKLNGTKTIIVPLYNGRIFEELKNKFPNGEIKTTKGFKFYEVF